MAYFMSMGFMHLYRWAKAIKALSELMLIKAIA
jgi:hypothetical protein